MRKTFECRDATTASGPAAPLRTTVRRRTRRIRSGRWICSITGDTLINELDRLAPVRGYPAVLRCDNGPELVCEAMADWAGEPVGLFSIPPGEPWCNGYIEPFNARAHDECLKINIFWPLVQTRVAIIDWRDDYDHRRRHSLLGFQAPTVYAAACIHRLAPGTRGRSA